MSRAIRWAACAAAVAAAAAGLMGLWGCATVAEVGAAVGEATGTLTHEQAQSVVKTGTAFGKALEQITPEQEYYVGRAVGATIVHQYKVFDREAATLYLNQVGQTLARASSKPETFGGYHFLILDSDEVNAFAAPGGLIFVSRGMLRLCANEDDLAAVLAHEIGHVQYGHAVAAISNARWTQAFTILGTEGAKSFGSQDLSQLTEALEGSINDITKTLFTSGYARGQERQADLAAVAILKRVGYDPNGLARLLTAMDQHVKPGSAGFGKTHPDPKDRIKDLSGAVGGLAARPAPPARLARFQQSLAGV